MARPNVLLILNDDMGYSDLGCYGGEIQTTTLDRLAAHGLRYTQFYNTARCCPSRASLLTGLHPHQADVGHMVGNDGVDGYTGELSRDSVTIAEVLQANGYHTFMSGKWHVTDHTSGSDHNWPRQRGFDSYYGIIQGACDYFNPGSLTRDNTPIDPQPGMYLTDAISDEMVRFIEGHAEQTPERPFFGYLAYTAPHWPLHAREQDIARYKGRFDAGWDHLRQERLDRMTASGIIDPSWRLTERDPKVPTWADAENKEWQTRRMEVYAAQVHRMDKGIGRIIDALEHTGQLDDTLILFLADNGGCAEEIQPGSRENMIRRGTGRDCTWDGRPVVYGNSPDHMPGGQDTYQSCGTPWANVQNTPFRLYKHWVHEGGISTPLIVHWPGGVRAAGELRHQPAQLPDVMATVLDITGAVYPERYADTEIKPCEGFSLVPTFANHAHERRTLYWEHEGNKAVRRGRWKLVCKHPDAWQLFDMERDRTETNDVADHHPDLVTELSGAWDSWAARCDVMPWDELQALRRRKRSQWLRDVEANPSAASVHE